MVARNFKEMVSANVQIVATLSASAGFLFWACAELLCERALTDLMSSALSDREQMHAFRTWVLPLQHIGLAVTGLPVGFGLDVFGRKPMLLTLSFCMIIGCLQIILAESTLSLLFGYITIVLSGGGICTAAPVFIAEIAHKSTRGKLLSCPFVMCTFGPLFIHLTAGSLSWRSQIALMLSAIMTAGFFIIIVPESPRYLALRGSTSESFQSLQTYRGTSKSSILRMEFQEIMQNARESTPIEKGLFGHLQRRTNLQGIAAVVPLMLVHVFAGEVALKQYSTGVIRASGTCLTESIMWTLISAICAMASALCAITIDKVGRRVVLMSSQLLLTSSLIIFALFYSLRNWTFVAEGDNYAYSWIGLMGLIGFKMACSDGLGPLSYVLVPEILSLSSRGAICGVLSTLKALLMLICQLTFEKSEKTLGPTCIWIYAAIEGVGLIVLWFVICETRLKSLEEIQWSLLSVRKMRRDVVTV